jgi:hypothetical protein
MLGCRDRSTAVGTSKVQLPERLRDGRSGMLRAGGYARPRPVVWGAGNGVERGVMLVADAARHWQPFGHHQRCGTVDVAVMRQTELQVGD